MPLWLHRRSSCWSQHQLLPLTLNRCVLLRLLLWDCDERAYRYYIETSTNQQHWTKVVDRTRVACR